MLRFAVVLAALPLAARADQPAARGAALMAMLQATVVNITSTTHETRGADQDNMAGEPSVSESTEQGSGFIVAPSGLIVTNRHAVAGATDIAVTLHDGTRLKACLLASAAQSDIALLRVTADRALPVAGFGDSDALQPGDPVFVIGNPLGLGSSVTGGIVSALRRNEARGGFSGFFQIDAAINHGSSGGPVFNAAGEVVGVATALISPAGETGSVGLGLAIPGRDARFIVERLVQDGRVRLGWIGVHIQPVTADIAAAVNLTEVAGAIVTEVDADSPAIRADIQTGDVISNVVGEAQATTQDLNRTIAASVVGSVVKLSVWRDGASRIVPVVVGESPEDRRLDTTAKPGQCPPARAARRDLGLVLGPITQDARAKLALPPQNIGALVTDVLADTVAEQRGITPGAVILNVQHRPVRAPADVQAAIDAARAAGSAYVLVLVRNASGLRWRVLPLG